MNQKNRIARLESQQVEPSRAQISDEARLDGMRHLSLLIAEEARRAGMTAQDDPRLALPLAIAEVLNEQP